MTDETDDGIDFSASDTAHLRMVMADDAEPGRLIAHDDGVYLSRVKTNRNLWELVVDGEAVVTLAPELIGTSEALARWIDARARLARSDSEEEEPEPAADEPWSGGFQ